MKRIPLDWIKHLADDAERKEFEAYIRNSGAVLRRFRQLIEDKERTLLAEETTPGDYDNPSWAYKQADRNGAKRALKQLKQLLEFLE
jgi:hypothetical protein